jgi:hypothetical protein
MVPATAGFIAWGVAPDAASIRKKKVTVQWAAFASHLWLRPEDAQAIEDQAPWRVALVSLTPISIYLLDHHFTELSAKSIFRNSAQKPSESRLRISTPYR